MPAGTRETHAMGGKKAPASGHWSIAAHLLALAASTCVLSTGATLMAPRVVRENLWADGFSVCCGPLV